MCALIVSDAHSIATKLRAALLRCGVECPASHVVSLDLAHEVVNRVDTAADVVFVILSPEPDRSLSRLQALRSVTQAKLVAVGPAQDPQQLLRCIHARADDYLAEDGDLDTDVATLLQRVKRDLSPRLRPARLISVVGASGGSGCSTIAANLAVAMAQQHGQCGLCDLHYKQGDLATLFDLKPIHTFSDLCRNHESLDQAMFEQSLLRHACGVCLTAAPHSLHEVTPEAVTRVLQVALASFHYMIVDLEDIVHREQIWVVEQSALVLVVLRLDIVSLSHAQRTMERLEHLGIMRERIYLVANRHGQPKELSIGSAERAIGLKIDYFVPDNPAELNASVNVGQPVLLEHPKSKVSKALTTLASGLTSSSTNRVKQEVLVHG